MVLLTHKLDIQVPLTFLSLTYMPMKPVLVYKDGRLYSSSFKVHSTYTDPNGFQRVVLIKETHEVKDFDYDEYEFYEAEIETEIPNLINHPPHYTIHPSGIECIEITRHFNFCLGNAIKYIWRAGLKNNSTKKEDIQKAIWYLEDELGRC